MKAFSVGDKKWFLEESGIMRGIVVLQLTCFYIPPKKNTNPMFILKAVFFFSRKAALLPKGVLQRSSPVVGNESYVSVDLSCGICSVFPTKVFYTVCLNLEHYNWPHALSYPARGDSQYSENGSSSHIMSSMPHAPALIVA